MSSRTTLDVRRVGSSIIATFGRANPPLIWRLDLECHHSFTMALQREDQEWELGMTSAKGEFQSVARFPMREDAEEALAEVGDVLAAQRFGWIYGFFKYLGIALLALFLLLWGSSLAMRLSHRAELAPRSESASETLSPPPVAVPPVEPATPSGVPVPADEALKPPSP